MTWTLTDDVDAYTAAVTPLLSSRPARYTVLMTVLDLPADAAGITKVVGGVARVGFGPG